MIKKIAWDTFKNTGNINTFLEFKQIEDIEKEIINNNVITNINLNSIDEIEKNQGTTNIKLDG